MGISAPDRYGDFSAGSLWGFQRRIAMGISMSIVGTACEALHGALTIACTHQCFDFSDSARRLGREGRLTPFDRLLRGRAGCFQVGHRRAPDGRLPLRFESVTATLATASGGSSLYAET